MARGVRRSVALALAGLGLGLLAGLGLVLALFDGAGALRSLVGRPALERPDAPGEARAALDPGGRTAPPSGTAAGPASPAATAPPAVPEAPASARVPSFDIVRVEPNGEAVVAGRAAPDAAVELLVDGRVVAEARADAAGQFALVPPALPTGSSAIALRARGADGRERRSEQSVAVAVAPGRDRRPLVALTAPGDATVVLSQPEPAEPAARQAQAGASGGAEAAGPAAGAGTSAAPGSPKLKSALPRVVSVDAQEGGRLYVTGAGAPGASLRLYLNDTLVAPGRVGPDGRVTFTIGRGVKPGRYRVRIDAVDAENGRVDGRAEVAFTVPEGVAAQPSEAARPETGGATHGPGRTAAAGPGTPPAAIIPPGRGAVAAAPGALSPEPLPTAPRAPVPGMAAAGAGPERGTALDTAPPQPGAVFVPEIGTARIIRGDNLWRISQRTYGRGNRYTEIYDANQGQIRNPDLIYPGQIFVLPTDKRG